VPEPQVLIGIRGLAFDQVNRHGVSDRKIQLAQRQTVEALAGDEVRLSDEVAGGDDGAVLDAVEEPLRPHTLRLLCPHPRTGIAVVVAAVVDAEGGPLTGGIEQSPVRKLADGPIVRGQLGHLRQRP